MRVSRGIYAASLTPLKQDLSIDYARLASHVRWLLENGCHGVVLLGTTGEANSFSVDERAALMERMAESELPLDRLLVGTGCCAYTDTIALTKRAHELGFSAALVLPPFYYKQVTGDGLYDGFSRLLDGVGDSSLRLLLYHFPRMAGVGFSMELISRLVTFYPEQIVGIKDSSGEAEHLEKLCREFRDLMVFTGTERLLEPCLASGGAGCISASVNVTSRLCRASYDAFKTGSDASREFDLAIRFREALEEAPFVPGLKYVFSLRRNEVAWSYLRPPLNPVDPSARRRLDHALAALPELPNFAP